MSRFLIGDRVRVLATTWTWNGFEGEVVGRSNSGLIRVLLTNGVTSDFYPSEIERISAR